MNATKKRNETKKNTQQQKFNAKTKKTISKRQQKLNATTHQRNNKNSTQLIKIIYVIFSATEQKSIELETNRLFNAYSFTHNS